MRETWGYEEFRPGQEEVLEAVLDGRDVLGVLPTGGGKSLCYQVPALVTEGVVLVVSPLIALMQDQVEGLRTQGIDATFINSTVPTHEIEQRWTDVEHGRYDLLYLAPERLTTDRFRARAERLDVSLLAVDEAHCVSEWGHNFRPDYLEIPEARSLLGEPPTIAVTATATPAVRRDVVQLLDMSEATEVVRGFDRPNIVWSVFRTEQKWAKLRDVVEGVGGTGIVYVATRRGVQRWTNRLRNFGVETAGYHGGMEASDREARQEAWVADDVRVMVATNAFGMGIDKPDVRFVVHADVPSSLEAYYQEAGRAGRDGKRAHAVLLFREPDADTQEALIESSHPTAEEVRAVYDAVCNVGQIPIGSEPDGPLVVDRNVVVKITGFSQAKVRTAVDLLDRQDAWRRVPRRKHFGLIRFRMGTDSIRRYAEDLDNRTLAAFVRTLLRIVHADAFSEWWQFDLRAATRRMGLSRERLNRGLRYLSERGLLDWQPPGAALQVELAFPRSAKLPVDDRAVQNARHRAETRLRYMLRYARGVSCRRHFLLTYFGETSPERCGTCDVCFDRHEPEVITPEDEPLLRKILRRVANETPRNDWFETPPAPRDRIDALVNWLVAEGGQFVLTDKGEEMLG
ncbi:MAG: RecQ family ATP-dependent DNA helicase [Bacteroidetes bacterium QH_7_62_13]|nr:MAG: RecQ family ATP-dependent DNA helicase [Bacteroidetes bacterium QH_7_62_13]